LKVLITLAFKYYIHSSRKTPRTMRVSYQIFLKNSSQKTLW